MQQNKILLVEDDESLGFVVQDNLEQHGLHVTLETSGLDGLDTFKEIDFDLCVLDVMLPVMDGFTLASKIRELNADIPIIFLTAKSMKADRIKGFKLGGDDYITKPFSIEELILRIEVFLKRSTKNKSNNKTKIYQLGSFTFNYDKLILKNLDFEKVLTQREADLLKLLITQQNTTVSRDDILVKLWGDNDYFKGRSMDVFISRLRKYLSKDSNLNIVNVHGVGFRLDVEE